MKKITVKNILTIHDIKA